MHPITDQALAQQEERFTRAFSQGDIAMAGPLVRIHFDWTQHARRLRSNYVVIYRYGDGRIGQPELYYDPSGRLEALSK
jgi:hypothetical protein